MTEPWFVKGSIEWLEQRLQKDFSAYEWGSGASTIWIAKRVKNLVSIEHNEGWFSLVSEKLNEHKLTNVVLRYESLGDNYTNSIKDSPDNNFDVIFIDGRMRLKCIENAKPKLKSNGILLLDNANRKRYTGASSLLENWKLLDFKSLTNTWTTNIWIKP